MVEQLHAEGHERTALVLALSEPLLEVVLLFFLLLVLGREDERGQGQRADDRDERKRERARDQSGPGLGSPLVSCPFDGSRSSRK